MPLLMLVLVAAVQGITGISASIIIRSSGVDTTGH